MARRIKETPVLTGKNARRFEREIKANESRKVPAADFHRAMETFRKIGPVKNA